MRHWFVYVLIINSLLLGCTTKKESQSTENHIASEKNSLTKENLKFFYSHYKITPIQNITSHEKLNLANLGNNLLNFLIKLKDLQGGKLTHEEISPSFAFQAKEYIKGKMGYSPENPPPDPIQVETLVKALTNYYETKEFGEIPKGLVLNFDVIEEAINLRRNNNFSIIRKELRSNENGIAKFIVIKDSIAQGNPQFFLLSKNKQNQIHMEKIDDFDNSNSQFIYNDENNLFHIQPIGNSVSDMDSVASEAISSKRHPLRELLNGESPDSQNRKLLEEISTKEVITLQDMEKIAEVKWKRIEDLREKIIDGKITDEDLLTGLNGVKTYLSKDNFPLHKLSEEDYTKLLIQSFSVDNLFLKLLEIRPIKKDYYIYRTLASFLISTGKYYTLLDLLRSVPIANAKIKENLIGLLNARLKTVSEDSNIEAEDKSRFTNNIQAVIEFIESRTQTP